MDIFNDLEIIDELEHQTEKLIQGLKDKISASCPQGWEYCFNFGKKGISLYNVPDKPYTFIQFHCKEEAYFYYIVSTYYDELLLIDTNFRLTATSKFYGGPWTSYNVGSTITFMNIKLPWDMSQVSGIAKYLTFIMVNCRFQDLCCTLCDSAQLSYPRDSVLYTITPWCIKVMKALCDEFEKLGHPELSKEPIFMDFNDPWHFISAEQFISMYKPGTETQ